MKPFTRQEHENFMAEIRPIMNEVETLKIRFIQISLGLLAVISAIAAFVY